MRIVITITIAKSILYLMLDVRFQMSLILLQNISHNAFAFLREHNHTSIPILSYPILSYPILSYPILSYPILSKVESACVVHTVFNTPFIHLLRCPPFITL